jgi:hypothetical protein
MIISLGLQKKLYMRQLLSALVFGILLLACNNPEKKPLLGANAAMYSKSDTSQFTTIAWLDSARDFGKMAEGQKLEVSFRFKNTGVHPLVIERVQPSCGCTIAEQPKAPVLPGEEGIIKATFDSEKHTGMNHKTLYVFANTKYSQSHELHFSVEVVSKKW